MNVSFYNFSKKSNSTAQPPASALITTLACNLKDGCTVTSPQIRVAWAANNMLPTYAYIPDWGRYYFVRDIEYAGSALIIRLEVDPLASYKAQIGASTQYILRSAAAFNTMMQDSLYPTEAEPDIRVVTQNTPFIGGGTYILGVIGRGSGGVGQPKGLVYYAMTPAQMLAFCDWCNSWGAAQTFGDAFAQAINTTIDTIAGQLLHIFDYVRTAFWVPLIITDVASGSAGAVVIGGYTIPASSGVTAYGVTNFNKIYAGANNICAFYLPGHPQESALGRWTNSAPFSQHYIDVPYLGEIPLDSAQFTAGDAAIVQADVSMVDGSAQFYVLLERDGEQHMIARYQSQLGVPIPINVVRSDAVGAAGNVISGVASALTGNFLGAASGIANAISSAIPQPQSIGGLSGYHVYHLEATLVSKRWMITGTDNANHGRPLCERRQISGLPGYIQTSGAALALAATDAERNAVTAQMDAGFFYE